MRHPCAEARSCLGRPRSSLRRRRGRAERVGIRRSGQTKGKWSARQVAIRDKKVDSGRIDATVTRGLVDFDGTRASKRRRIWEGGGLRSTAARQARTAGKLCVELDQRRSKLWVHHIRATGEIDSEVLLAGNRLRRGWKPKGPSAVDEVSRGEVATEERATGDRGRVCKKVSKRAAVVEVE
jgi:hypothetical protein